MNTVFVDGHGRCEVWGLPKISSTRQHRYRYSPESFTHPAKMDVVLCRKIIEVYTREGETVLDPMSGVGTTLIEAALLGRDALGVELEASFVKLSKKNIRLLKKLHTLAQLGKAIVIKGDSRELSRILGEKADKVIFSPPYRERYAYKNPEERQKDDPTASKRNRIHKPYSQDPNNIGNLKYGEPVDAVVTSPPFFSTVQERGYQGQGKHNIAVDPAKHGHKGIITLYAQSGGNINNIEKYGQVDAIVTSPPFGEAQRGGGIAKKGYRGPKHGPTDLVGRRTYMPENTGGTKGNISNMSYGKVDAIVTSPPFAQTPGGLTGKHNIGAQIREGRPTRASKRTFAQRKVSEDPRNIDNLATERYGDVDVIVTSPPYSESMSKRRKGYTTHPELSRTRHMGLGSSDENIGNLRHGSMIDAIGKVQKRCMVCDRIFYVHPYRKKTARFCSVKCRGKSQKGKHFSKETEFKREKPYPAVDDTQLELILGTLLGDAYLDTRPKLPRLSIGHSTSQRGYFDWKVGILGDLVECKPSERENSLSVSTITHPIFAEVEKLMYDDGRKKVTWDLLNSLSLFSLAVWFMDDASCDKGMSITLATCGFTIEENKIIQDWFSDKFGLNPSIKMKKEYPTLYFKKKDAYHLSQLLKPYIHPSMAYKFAVSEMYHRKPILPHGKVDSIITPPPYEKSIHEGHEGTILSPAKEMERMWLEEPEKYYGEFCKESKYGSSGENIGSKKGETYLQAMFQVYRECYKTLKPGGKMVLVLKNFIRNFKVKRLDLDTKRLCEAAGFRWVGTKLFKLYYKSFWRTQYAHKYPNVDTSLLRFEFVEVFEKPPEAWA